MSVEEPGILTIDFVLFFYKKALQEFETKLVLD
jgi:hypothetical protein